ncbi:DUF2711 family protein [Saliterribacillus persicus]|uniref:Uncharacterized protein DUF2711 n=1 Tax=Saliterribacillus persicus TaxID=930114 RepID=A0A368Y064_9BACI|nr:DUF2711 family protein [Saliterribacillus persicus]RCW73089.1 uncharacterized protein DUF2711 [Saliterribacillus persicus]
MKYFHPIMNSSGNEKILNLLPSEYKNAWIIFLPFIEMPDEWIKENSTPTFPTNKEILNVGRPVSWEYLRKKSNINSIANFSIAVNTKLTNGFGRELYTRTDLSQQLTDALSKNVFFPQEDNLSVFVIKSIFDFFSIRDCEKIEYAFIDDENIYSLQLDSMTSEDILKLSNGPITISDCDKDYVFTFFFDEVSALLFSKDSISDVVFKRFFEGVNVDKYTIFNWEEQYK